MLAGSQQALDESNDFFLFLNRICHFFVRSTKLFVLDVIYSVRRYVNIFDPHILATHRSPPRQYTPTWLMDTSNTPDDF